MFDQGQPDLSGLLAQAQQMQQQLAAIQQELADARIEGTAAGGAVAAVVSGVGELVDLRIAAEVIDPSDPQMLADLVLAAVRDAAGNARRHAEELMGPLAGGLGGFGGPGTGGPSGLGGLGGVPGLGG